MLDPCRAAVAATSGVLHGPAAYLHDLSPLRVVLIRFSGTGTRLQEALRFLI
jgi:hypothetical protein